VIDGIDNRTNVVKYIHQNPLEANLTKKFSEWEFDSYNALISDSNTLINRDEVLNWFDGRENFIAAHKKPE
jgi:putative transposase